MSVKAALLARKRLWIVLAGAVMAVCIGTLVYLLTSVSLDRGQGIWTRLLIFAVGLTSGVAMYMASREDGKRAAPKGRWNTRSLALIVVAFYAAIGSVTGILPFLTPQAPVESAPFAIENKIDALKSAADCPMTSHERWVDGERTLPIFAIFDAGTSPAQRQAVLDAEARRICAGYAQGEYRLVASRGEAAAGACSTSTRSRCEADGIARCSVKIREEYQVKACRR